MAIQFFQRVKWKTKAFQNIDNSKNNIKIYGPSYKILHRAQILIKVHLTTLKKKIKLVRMKGSTFHVRKNNYNWDIAVKILHQFYDIIRQLLA